MAFNDDEDEDEEDDMEEGPLLAAGFERALIAVGTQGGHEIAIYDYEKCVRILMKRDAMERNDAIEFMDYNVLCVWMGERTPVFIIR